MLGLAASLAKGGASLLTYVKDNLKLYLNFTSNKSDTLKFPCEGSTSFDGSDDGIDTGNIFSGGETQATFSAWIWADETGTSTDKLVGQTDESSNAADPFIIFWVHSSNAIQFWFSDGGGTNYRYIASSAVTANTWHHLACTADLSTGVLKMYVDGVDLGLTVNNNASPPSSVAANTTTNYIGQGRSTGGDMWKGKVANMAIWTRVLSIEEINPVMRKSYSQLGSVEKTSLVSWWALDSSGEIDITTNGNFDSASNWTLSGGQWSYDSGNKYMSYGSGGAEGLKQAQADLAMPIVGGASYTLTFTVSDGTARYWIMNATQNVEYKGKANYTAGTHTITFTAPADVSGGGISFYGININGGEAHNLDSVSLKVQNSHSDLKSSNNGSTVGATTTTSVYGGHAPVLPRAVDVAREGEAEAIGDGSASFTIGDTDYIEINNTGIVLQDWTISFWARTGANLAGDFPGIVSTRSGTLNDYQDGVTLHYYDDYFDSEGASLTGHLTKVAGNTNLDDGEWHHVVFTCDRDGKQKQYINGVFIVEEDATDNPTNADIIQIGARYYSTAVNNHWDGNIAQVGMWQGILTQAQVQSLYESTSYAKIPADVKSTLGGECVANGDFSGDASLWNQTDAKWSIDETNDYASYADGADGSLIQTDGNNLVSIGASKFYRIKFTISSGSSNAKVHWYSANVSQTLAAEGTYADGDHTIYATSPADYSGGVTVRGKNAGGTYNITNISIKEVTNDLVGYWALDAVQTSDFATKYVPDSLGGELGSELFTGWENNSLVNQGYYNGWSSFTTSGQTVTASQADEGGIYNKVFNTETFSVVEGTAYEINMTVDSRSNVYIRGLTASTNSESSVLVHDLIWTSLLDGVKKFVVLANTTSSSARLHIRQFGGATASITISAISIKPLSGNYGRLL